MAWRHASASGVRDLDRSAAARSSSRFPMPSRTCSIPAWPRSTRNSHVADGCPRSDPGGGLSRRTGLVRRLELRCVRFSAMLGEQGGEVDTARVEECWRRGRRGPGPVVRDPGTQTGICWSIGTKRVELTALTAEPCTKQSHERSASTWRRRSTLVGHGVELGAFRGPTLHLTDRWIAVEPLLTATVGISLAAFVLARKAEIGAAGVGAGATCRPGCSRSDRSSGRLARQAQRVPDARAAVSTHSSPSSTSSDPPIGEQVPPGREGGAVHRPDRHREHSTAGRPHDRGREADPLVIACVVDARDEHGPVRLLNRTIPVVSLTATEIGYSGPATENITDIDPLMLKPTVPPLAGRHQQPRWTC